jgi:hypothetical protein
MGLAGARATCESDITPSRQERSGMQCADQFLVDRAVVEHELLDVLDRR